MKPGQNHPETSPILAIGAHPDDIEFGCGAVIAKETRAGRPAHFVVCSRGEASTNGAPIERAHEAEKAAKILGATLEFVDFGGDAHLQYLPAHSIALAGIIRRLRPSIVLAPTPAENQHPDHAVVSKLARDAARLARYGGIAELRASPAHAIDALFFYAITAGGEPGDVRPLLIDVSAPEIITTWTAAMEAHATQMKTRNYIDLQLTRAHLNGLHAGVSHAVALYPSEPLLVDSLTAIQTARRF